MASDAELVKIARETTDNALAALAMIRETIETLGPPGILSCPGALGPEPVHEGEAIVTALQQMLAERPERARG